MTDDLDTINLIHVEEIKPGMPLALAMIAGPFLGAVALVRAATCATRALIGPDRRA